MKKVILILIIGLLGFLTYNTVTNGTQLFGYSIPSYTKIIDDNKSLDTEANNLTTLINTTYATEVGYVTSAKQKFNEQKQLYDSLAANATDEQLEAAMREEEFLLDYLWILVGNYADDNEVKVLMDVKNGTSIEFDVTGSYISIINFVYDIANDPELKFVVDNIQLEGGSNQDTVTKAKFTVDGLNIVTKTEN